MTHARINKLHKHFIFDTESLTLFIPLILLWILVNLNKYQPKEAARECKNVITGFIIYFSEQLSFTVHTDVNTPVKCMLYTFTILWLNCQVAIQFMK